jgi:hypothetical protein
MQTAKNSMIGHNNPPSDPALMAEMLAENNAKALKRAEALIEAADRVPAEIADQDTSDKITDLEKQITVCWNVLEEARKTEKRPYLNLCEVVQTFFAAPQDTLAAGKKRIKAIQTKFLIAEEEKERKRRAELAAQQKAESDRQAAEAAKLEQEGRKSQADAVMEKAVAADHDAAFFSEAAKATGSAVAVSQGEMTGAKTSLRYVPTGEIEDMATLDLEALRPYIKAADAQKFLNAFVKVNGITRQIKGAKIWNKPDAVTR